jgi:hypothetical protein
MRFLLMSLLLYSFCILSYGQTEGKLEVVREERIGQLVEKHIQLNEKQAGIPGYRIQIFFASGNNSKPNANRVRAEFLAKFSQINAYVVFQEPYYKVRVGDFRTRLEAQGFLNIVTHNFPSSYIVSDEIQFPELE